MNRNVKLNNIIKKSNYDDLNINKQGCISLKYSKLRESRIKRLPGNDIHSVRLLMDIATLDESENEVIDYLNKMVNINPYLNIAINVEDEKCFEKAKRIMSGIKSQNKVIKLYPDKQLKDRTSINLSDLNCITIIPLQYLMWHNNIENAHKDYIRFDRYDNSDFDGASEFSERENKEFTGDYYRLEDVLKLKKVVLQILNNELSFKVPHSDLQKVLLVSHYMSKNIIFPDYDNMENNEKDKMHHAYYTLTQKKGVCEGQSEAFMLLVNNPQIKIDCRVLGGYADSNDVESGHNWNILKIKESNYVNKGEYFIYDQTWVNNDDGTMEFKYAFIPVMKLRSSLDGVGGKYNMYEEKLPDDFLEHQLKDAIQREIQAKKVLKVENLEELLDNYNKTK